MKPQPNQPDMFPDVSLIKPKTGADAGLQAMLDGGHVLRTTEPTEACQEASEILKRGVKQWHNV